MLKPILCPHCESKTKMVSTDKRYVNTHNIILRYRDCTKCGSRFITKQTVGNDDEKIFRCYKASKHCSFLEEE